MSEKNFEECLKEIICKECEEIKKIKIEYDIKEKLINIIFECGHQINNQKGNLKNSIFCLNCQKSLNQEIICENENHKKIENNNIIFYCRIHYKKYKGYCLQCKKNICEDYLCEHEYYNENYDFYLTKNQLNELIYKTEEVQNFFNTIISIEYCNKIIEFFSSYYNVYVYIYQNNYFHINVIYNINLFYNFFISCIDKKISNNGCFIIDNINNIKDESIFYDDDFNEDYEEILDLDNFNNIKILFLFSKRMKRKAIYFNSFCLKIYSNLNNYVNESNLLNTLCNFFLIEYSHLKDKMMIKIGKLDCLKQEINIQLLNFKLNKIIIPSNLKRKLINILLKIIIKKYKNYLYHIKPNKVIINQIKRKYQIEIKNKKEVYSEEGKKIDLELKLKEIENIKEDNLINNKDIVYFEYNFKEKIILNTFLYFMQELHFQKSDEILFSNQNQSISVNEKAKNLLNLNDDDLNSINQQNHFIIYDSNEFLQYLKQLEENINKVLYNIKIKKNLNFIDIINSLFENQIEKIITQEENIKNEEKEIQQIINNCIFQHKNIKINEDDVTNSLKIKYQEIKENQFLLIGNNIINKLYKNKKYRKLIEQIKEQKETKNEIYDVLNNKLINLGGFNKENSKLIIQIIKNYFHIYKQYLNIEEIIKKIPQYSLEYSQLLLEIEQLNNIKEYLIEKNNEINSFNKRYELNKFENLKNNFQTNFQKYLNDTIDDKFKEVLKEIKQFIETKSITDILETLKTIFPNVESPFYFDDSDNILIYSWASQNGHSDILEGKTN